MATKNNPGEHDCYTRALPDEPLFTLLGRDASASFVVLFWCKMRLLMSGVEDSIGEAQQVAESMRDWAVTLGKEDKLKLGYDAFRTACAEVAKHEIEAEAKEIFSLVQLYGLKCDIPQVQERFKSLCAKLAGVA
jgi:hypothetical protein